MKAAKRSVKKRAKKSDTFSVTMSLPDEVYFELKRAAKDEIRSLPQQARYFMEIGMQVISQQLEMSAEGPIEEEEKQPAIGFMVDREEGDIDDD